MGTEAFREIFKSITVDNGSEFLDWQFLERSIDLDDQEPRTQIYYCRSYSAWQRGSNEQLNGLIRRFIPKGSDLSQYSTDDIQKLEDWLNSTPRKLFEGKSSNEMVEQAGIKLAS
ncbi:IS30 family transposase [Allofustis seminis]|uniref:IS30 family transposase n=1 Tax=Allofustis seminis TaxID=166939 RepID=UPI000475420A|nr:IS30 family transposase [Allofustis seminis]